MPICICARVGWRLAVLDQCMDNVCRGARVIIMSDAKLRNKYYMLLDWRVQAFAIVNATLSLLAVATYIQTTEIAQKETYCLGKDTTDATGYSHLRLPHARVLLGNSAYQHHTTLSTACQGTLAAFYILGGPYLVLNGLMGLGVVPLDTRVHVFIIAMAFVIITDVTVISRNAWTDLSPMRHSIKLSKRFSAGVRTAVDTVSQHNDAYAAKWQTSTEIMKSPAMNAAFAAHVERYAQVLCWRCDHYAGCVCISTNTSAVTTNGSNYSCLLRFIEHTPCYYYHCCYCNACRCLCYESYRFLADAMNYVCSSFESPLEQHAAFEKLVQSYIAVGSTFEILKSREQSVFTALSEESRRNIFKEAAAEVAHM
eukprot:12623-Heterococcus_DN1.PRE.2